MGEKDEGEKLKVKEKKVANNAIVLNKFIRWSNFYLYWNQPPQSSVCPNAPVFQRWKSLSHFFTVRISHRCASRIN